MTNADPASPADEPGSAVENAAFVLALRERGVRDRAVLRAMERVPRERFAPAAHRDLARRDLALPLPCGATMTAPTTVAAMLVALDLAPGQRVLEIGTGSGYVTALLLQLGAAAVTSLELYAGLAAAARERLGPGPALRVLRADGLAAPGEGPYDRILANGSVTGLPGPWVAALAPGGRLVAGLSGAGQRGIGRLIAVERGPDGLSETLGAALRLVPLQPGRAAAA
ncbi:protein-L-isoaspartate O-methyltransferase family protein [Methylobacterium oxalidis]|uniref:Protein-L-isoaspartate O-methyltransferase n=1 Tax=Methylobacterium oxalidis TaxID=944322 RepID=A0A512J219_9HYPH|nr:rRNA adenine N-6-methyltransferase family protein [Methylobacterium oxalidis]GEP03973.1 protein-L-isoaspartate O-methyltransferase [Methylobacterium oxalidis]GJE31565.1 Protein-L-isoaspartate O-methyltransferase [Methylobacterium oxalidis]GLS64005.1 protein-L-isoaspartate O-methyltransferase [Methylobacterium oxalidis]